MELEEYNDDLTKVWQVLFKSTSWIEKLLTPKTRIAIISDDTDSLLNINSSSALNESSKEPIKVLCGIFNGAFYAKYKNAVRYCKDDHSIGFMNTSPFSNILVPLQDNVAMASVHINSDEKVEDVKPIPHSPTHNILLQFSFMPTTFSNILQPETKSMACIVGIIYYFTDDDELCVEMENGSKIKVIEYQYIK